MEIKLCFHLAGCLFSLQETIAIPANGVAYAAVDVKNGDSHLYGGVHEIRRHPEFRNGAIFIPERQKKKICMNVRLHMSIRNRIATVQVPVLTRDFSITYLPLLMWQHNVQYFN
jgi:hypothetical protein